MPAGPEKERKQKQRGADLATQRDAFSLEAASLLDPAAGQKAGQTLTGGRGQASANPRQQQGGAKARCRARDHRHANGAQYRAAAFAQG